MKWLMMFCVVILSACSLMLIHGDDNTVIDQTKEGLIIENDK